MNILSTTQKKAITSDQHRAQGFVDRRTKTYNEEIAYYKSIVAECTRKLAESEIAEQNKVAAKSDVTDLADRKTLKKADRL